MKTTDLEFEVQYYTWLSDLLTIFDLIRTNKHAEFTKDEVIEFTLKKNSLIAHFTTISDEVAIQFAEYLKELGFNAGEFKNGEVIVDFDYEHDGKYLDNDLYNKLLNLIKDELNVYPY